MYIRQYVIFGTQTHRVLCDADFIRETHEHKNVSDIKNATIKPLILRKGLIAGHN